MAQQDLESAFRKFCMAPWVHLHVLPEGAVYSCCMADTAKPLGSVHESDLKDIWNSPKMRELRLNMLAGKESAQCRRCYETESGAGHEESLRKSLNARFKHHFSAVEQTAADGSVEKMNLPYFDIRFSNLCNMKCRSCGPRFSSAWYEDSLAAGAELPPSKLLNADKDGKLWRELLPYLPYIEEAVFAGGESLLIKEHFDLLQFFVEQKMFHVALKYTTNFSELNYQGRDILSIWKMFPKARISASLDAMGARAEYIRKNTVWRKIEENRRRMLEVCPEVYFEIAPTVGAYNVLHLPDFHRDWVERGLVDADHFRLNILLDPEQQSAQILPAELKLEVRRKYEAHIQWLSDYEKSTKKSTVSVRRHFQSIIDFVFASDKSHQIHNFLVTVETMDRIRGENFSDVLPELQVLKEKVK